MEKENNRSTFYKELMVDINNTDPRILEVCRENGKIYLAKFDYKLYFGRKTKSNEELIEVSQDELNRICKSFKLTPEYYSLKTRERETSVNFYRKVIEGVFRTPYIKEKEEEER